MQWRRNRWTSLCGVAIALAMACVASKQAVAQSSGVAGVEIDAEGTLRTKMVVDPSGVLTRERMAHAKSTLPANLVAPSRLRMVSINRLEAAVAERLERGEELTPEMLNLAGLTSIENVFYYPETKDIVIAGPAEGFYENAAGRSVGLASGKAILQLEDLIVALRAFSPDARSAGQIGCSIDPTAEGLQRMQGFLASLRNVRPSDANRIAAGLRESLGMQNVSVQGVAPESHFAQVLVEADYRMKLIGIGLEQPPVEIRSYVSRANPRQVAANAMQRWFFTPDYDCILVSKDGLAMQMVGNGVKLIGADEMVSGDGERSASGDVNKASKAFCTEFTKKFDQLANKAPVYAQLRNLVDMSIVAAYVKHQDYFGQADWNLGVFADESKLPVNSYAAPKHVESAVNVVWKGNMLMTPIGGGVEIHAQRALSQDHLQFEEDGKIAKLRDSNAIEGDSWWWD